LTCVHILGYFIRVHVSWKEERCHHVNENLQILEISRRG
jgi:hypothetical protein